MNLPETWIETRLGDILHRVESKIDPQTSHSEGHFYVGLEHIESHTGQLLRDIEEVTASADILSIKTAFKKGDILYGKLRPNLNKVYLASQDGICSTDIWALRAAESVLPEYALYYLRSSIVYIRAAQLAVGANLPRLTAKDFDYLRIPLPTLPEQLRIVNVLKQGGVVHELSNKAQRLLDSLARQRFVDMFGHPAENPKGFDLAALQSFGTLDRGVSKHRPRDAVHLFEGPYPFIQTGDVSNAGDWINSYKSTYSEAGLAQSKLWPKGTLCITIAANIAKASILEFDACFPDSVVGFLPNGSCTSEYILYCLRFYQEYFEHRAPKSAQMNINLDALRTLRIPKPPERLQKEFSKFVHEIHALAQVATKQSDSRTSLMRELTIAAFTGELSTNWRECNQEEVKAAADARDSQPRYVGAKVSLAGNARISLTAEGALDVFPKRSLVQGELSEFQRQVLAAFNEVYQQTPQPLIVEDPGVFSAFCDSDTVTRRLQGFGPSVGNRIRRSLSQLAALGLIAKVTLPKQDRDTGELELLKAFRPLRSEEFTRMSDVASLRNALGDPVGDTGESG